MECKETLEWYRKKKFPKYESFYEGTLGSDLLFRARTQCLNVNTRNYRWSESQSKECQMCDRGVDETVLHVVLECEKYSRERTRMMQVFLREMGEDINVSMERRTGREWMILLLRLSGITNGRVTLLDKGWTIAFQWIPSHVGIIGNEIVDQATKQYRT